MFSAVIRRLPHSLTAAALIATAVFSTPAAAVADPGQDQKFFDLLNQQDIPPVDNDNSLIDVARKTCSRLDEGMSVGDLVELIRNNGFNENPLTRLQNQGRITRTIDRFINAAVQAYCPNNRGKIASIAAYHRRPDGSRIVVLASFVEPLPAGDILPTKPLPVPAQQPQPVPQEIQPQPQQPPPPTRRVQPAPPQAPAPVQQPDPPPAEAPAPEPGPPAEAPAPGSGPTGGGGPTVGGGSPGGGSPGGDAPARPTPDQPAPPGHIRLAP
ncbi:DUF732 domain-containing protein [Mycobacterium sp.]|uniref:DUF732 domain-containing protein n=1 Tax=Mycobacterium sp. TaxID=1785 RepID=UPI003D0F65CC